MSEKQDKKAATTLADRIGYYFNLEEQLAFYRAYHLNPKNVKIHLFCIPPIFISSIIIVTYINIPSTNIRLNLVGLILYSTYYIVLSPVVGLITSSLIFLIYSFAEYLFKTYTQAEVLSIAIFINILAWGAQFVGHYVYEKKQPSVLDNLAQPLALAPFFVGFELLFLAGYDQSLEKKINKLGMQMRRELDHPSEK